MTELIITESVRVAVISTAHVTYEDSLILREIPWNSYNRHGIHWVQSTNHGWIFRINSDPDNWAENLRLSSISEGAISNLQQVVDAGYGWIHFDADGPEIEGLQRWDW